MITDIEIKPYKYNCIKNFKCSNSWLYRYSTIYNILYKRLSGSEKLLNRHAAERFVDNWMCTVKGYESGNIINCDETGLYIKGLQKYLYVTHDTSKVKKTRKR